MRPGPRIWASNAVWAGGPDAGTASKSPPSAGQLADGYYRGLRVAPQIWNFERWALAERVQALAWARLLNLRTLPISSAWPVGWAGGATDGIFDTTAATRAHTIADATGAGLAEEYLSAGGLIYAAGAPPIAASAAPRLAVDGAGVRALVTGVAAADVQASAAYAAWGAWGGGALGTWVDIDYGGVGANARWVIGEGATGAIRRSTAPAAAFTLPAAAPGFAAGVSCLAYSHHYAGDLYPDDPGAHGWMALTAAQYSVAVDATANNWSAAAAHGLPNPPVDLCYSRHSGSWFAVDAAGAGNVSVSPDSGASWTTTLVSGIATTVSRIATDGYGAIVCLFVDAAAGTYEVRVSADDGATWRLAPVDLVVAGITDGAVWYGEGRFSIMVTDGAAAGAIYVSDLCGE